MSEAMKKARELLHQAIHEGWYVGPESGESWDRLTMTVPAPLFSELVSECDTLRIALIEAQTELERWGHGDFHYGRMPRDPRVLAALAAIDAALQDGQP